MEKNKHMKGLGSDKSSSNRPSPYDFMEFLPWACKQYGVDVTVHSMVIGTKQTTSTRKMKLKSSKSTAAKDKISSTSSLNLIENIMHDESSIGIGVMAIFDHTHSLISIKIENNVKVPRTVFQVIALIIEFYPSLTLLSADKGLDALSIYEITKILSKSSITEVCLDGACLTNPNYYILLETVNNLKCLSLARCQISDEIIKKIAENLEHRRPAARTLTFLSLSSNRITDTGAAHLADALKTNRHLAYLNLADNHITDTGASHIFDIMLDFPIMGEDLEQSKIRRRKYNNEKNKLFYKFVKELKSTEEAKSAKRKGNDKLLPTGRGKTNRQPEIDQHKNKKIEDWTSDKVASLKSLAEVKVPINLDVKFFPKAENLALQAIGKFEDPFENAYSKDEIEYCTGNNTLTCLNLAFNNLSYNILQKLIEVLYYQKEKQQIPRGLFRVRLEGNYLPSTCAKYTEIKGLLNFAMEATSSKQTIKSPRRLTITKHKLGVL